MTPKKKHKEVPVSKLRTHCSPKKFSFKTTDDVDPLKEIIGQERALRALQLGLDIESSGYNIFITGFAGTGRKTTIKSYLGKITRNDKLLYDFCYLNNFKNPDMPLLVSLPAGQGMNLKKDMSEFVDSLLKNVPMIFEGEQYEGERKKLVDSYQEREKTILKQFEEEVVANGFAVIQVQYGNYTKPEIAPVRDGKAIPVDQLIAQLQKQGASEQDLEQLKTTYRQLKDNMEEALKKSRDLGRLLKDDIQKLDADFVLPFIDDLVSDLKNRFDNPRLHDYFEDVRQDCIENIDLFKGQEEEQENPLAKMMAAGKSGDPLLPYSVNVIVDNSHEKEVPIIIENFPSYKNLFGTIERVVDRSGVMHTDFTRIKPGSIARANGGYLVLDATDTLSENGVWPTMKRVLKTGTHEIHNFDPFSMASASALKPEPIPINVKVVMIGERYLYHRLFDMDADFKKIFKVKADFDSTMSLNGDSLNKYAAFIKKISDDEHLLPFTADAVSEIVEYGMRLSERRKHLSTRFSHIADLIRESSYWASRDKNKTVKRKHVEQTLDERILRLNLVQERMQAMIHDGIIMIDTDGGKVGEVNGLAVYNYGDFMFGKPSKISVQVSTGKAGFINIEREAKLSGKIHDKGVLILSGYFRGKFAQKKPLSLSASICFEQSYSGVDGDSASSTEVYALLSALSGLPINQGIAVTGSINQKGEIQPIGGVNEKIEGFFDICSVRGLTGEQGVIIPHQNVSELMLRKDVVKAVKEKKFHVYPVETVDQGIEILTGNRAGRLSAKGNYPRGSVNFLVNKRLQELADAYTPKNNKKPRAKKK